LTYKGIASGAVFTGPLVVGEFTLSHYNYWRPSICVSSVRHTVPSIKNV